MRLMTVWGITGTITRTAINTQLKLAVFTILRLGHFLCFVFHKGYIFVKVKHLNFFFRYYVFVQFCLERPSPK